MKRHEHDQGQPRRRVYGTAKGCADPVCGVNVPGARRQRRLSRSGRRQGQASIFLIFPRSSVLRKARPQPEGEMSEVPGGSTASDAWRPICSFGGLFHLRISEERRHLQDMACEVSALAHGFVESTVCRDVKHR